MKTGPPHPTQESVWGYPRPPRIEPSDRHIEVWFAGSKIADSRRSLRVLETSHPPVYYLPPCDLDLGAFVASPRQTYCEWKGVAVYHSLAHNDLRADDAAWSYPEPTSPFEALRDLLAIYPSKVDECRVDGERVFGQEGDFYGGWITRDIVGPFKGPPTTLGW